MARRVGPLLPTQIKFVALALATARHFGSETANGRSVFPPLFLTLSNKFKKSFVKKKEEKLVGAQGVSGDPSPSLSDPKASLPGGGGYMNLISL